WVGSGRTYGVPRMTAALWRKGIQVNHKTVERLMAEVGIQGRRGRRKTTTTRRDPKATPAPDLVNRDFDVPCLDQLWIADVTYVPTGEGYLYLSAVLDACSRRLIGWSMADHLRTELCSAALRQALATRDRSSLEGVVFHSDHGCQYTSGEYKELCRILGLTQSMGTVGDSYDNAMVESFFSTLKGEFVDLVHFATRQEARLAIFEWIFWYNYERLHSSVGYVPPAEFEELQQGQPAA
ncbi:MAG TPA: IS3 family transposase, partial [Acidimicrobiales bacterium]|nr:IS3 family transposase [Acidimicrobiales bacterium]